MALNTLIFQLFGDSASEFEKNCEVLLSDNELISFLKNQSFDFGLLEAVDNCGFGLLKLIGIENYAVETPMAMSCQFASVHGLPGRSYIRFPHELDNHPNLGFFQRVINFLDPILFRILNNYDTMGLKSVRKHVDPDFDTYEALAKAKLLFINSEEHVDFPRPLSNKFVYIGGINIDNDSKNISTDYDYIFDSSDRGVIVISFGSLALSKDMPKEYREAFISMFKQFPDINFIWKYEDPHDMVAHSLPNVFKFKWIDQKSILRHPKLLAFISHGGMNSILESAYAGVPLLSIPLFGDQHRNVRMLEFRNTSIVLQKAEISRSSLIDAVRKLTDPEVGYKTRAQRLSIIIKSKPLPAREKFTKYFNHAVNFKDDPDYFEIKERNFTFIRYYNLDLYLFILLCALISITLVYSIMRIVILKITSLPFKSKKE